MKTAKLNPNFARIFLLFYRPLRGNKNVQKMQCLSEFAHKHVNMALSANNLLYAKDNIFVEKEPNLLSTSRRERSWHSYTVCCLCRTRCFREVHRGIICHCRLRHRKLLTVWPLAPPCFRWEDPSISKKKELESWYRRQVVFQMLCDTQLLLQPKFRTKTTRNYKQQKKTHTNKTNLYVHIWIRFMGQCMSAW